MKKLEQSVTLGNIVALDLETTGLEPHSDRIIGAALADSSGAYWVSPEELNYLPLDRTYVLQNYKFDMRFLAAHTKLPIDMIKVEDTWVMANILDENGDHDLETLINQYLGHSLTYKTEFWSKYKKAEEAPKEALVEYALNDVKYTLELYHTLNKLIVDAGKMNVYRHVMQLAAALLKTEVKGIKIDLDYIQDIGVALQSRIQNNTESLRKLCEVGCQQWELKEWLKEIDKKKTDKGKANVKKPTFSFDSSKQLSELLYDIMKLPEQLSKERKRTVDDNALKAIEHLHPAIPIVRDQREASKLYGTYIQGILERAVNDRIYATFNVCGTVTGRISHQNPNMGNMPRDGGLRGMFVPDTGFSIISADYGQLEICLAAHFSEDEVLLETVRQGKSMHDITAKALDCDRQLAKTLNFGILYGASKWKVMEIFKCKEEEAQTIIDKFFRQFPGLKKIIDYCHKCVEDDIPIVNPFGRTRSFKGQYTNRRELERCKRQAFNALIQGTGGDLTNRAFYLIAEELENTGIGNALFTVHDEVLIQARDEYVAEAKEIISKHMLGVGQEISLKVPLTIDVSEPLKRWEK